MLRHVILERNRRKASLLLRSEMKRHGVTYAELAQRTGRCAGTLQNKIPRGAFTAKFFLECLAAIGCKTLDIS